VTQASGFTSTTN
jgi:hypothetical protein